ncbi:MAG TPA: NAD-dependent epimerase/dehydratase family protein [Vineibacter sp.]|nr:NAD-dependent epimerase/dehydratase family protein [Vineibacter sp.]
MSGLVAVSGATGFIGQHLIATLSARGVRLRLLVRRLPVLPADAAIGSIELVLGDVTDPPTLRRLVSGATAVIHLAGAIKALRRADFFRQNAQPVADLLAALAATDTRARVLLMSSLAAREPHLSDYAASKRAGEDHLLAAPPVGGWHVIRAPAVYGPGDRATLAFFRWVKRGIAPLPGGRPGRVSLIHVADLCGAVATALGRPPADGIYEIDDGTDGGYSLREMAAVAAERLGRRARPVPLPRPLLTGVAGLQQVIARLTGQPAILSPGKVREIFHPDWRVRDRRLAGALGFAPRLDIRRGFTETIDWYVRHKWL